MEENMIFRGIFQNEIDKKIQVTVHSIPSNTLRDAQNLC